MYTLKFSQTRLNNEVGRVTSFTFVFWAQKDHEDRESDIIYWRQYLYTFLSSLRIPCAVSPAHDRDVKGIDTSTGLVTYRDCHWHVVVDFGSGNTKTIKQIYDLISPIRHYISIAPWDEDVPDYESVLDAFDVSALIFSHDDDEFEKLKKVWLTCNCVRNMRSLLRYFKHLDNPEKVQYTDDIRSIGGFEVEDRIYSQTDQYYLLDQIFDYIEANHIYSFWKLLTYCRKNNREWYTVICKAANSLTIINALKSFAVEDTGYLDKKIEKYESVGDSSL